MRETKFIEQNQEKWSEFEEMLRQNHRDPDRLNELFIQITDDLSYARTYYPNRSVRMYLNSLAQRIFHNIYRGKRFPAKRFLLFWTDELPRLMWESRQALLLSFSVFLLSCIVGVVSSRINPDFARVVMGDGYVEMTLRNIENGDPMAVYKSSQPLGMAVGIAANNLFVAFKTAIFGVLGSIGTVFMLMYNGVILGAFQYFFVEKGLFRESFLTIWIHGTLEISAIILAGAAGMVAGSGLLFPGTYTRVQAFQMSVKRGLKMFIGLIPMFLLAAFFEGFLTRFTETPDAVRFMFILCSAAFVLWYFVWLPHHKSQLGFSNAGLERELPATREQAIDFYAIKNAGELFSDVFTLILRHPRLLWLGATAAAAASVMLVVFTVVLSDGDAFSFPSYPTGSFSGWWDGIRLADNPLFFGGQVFLLWGLAQMAFRAAGQELPEGRRANWLGSFWRPQHLVVAAVAAFLLWFLQTDVVGGFLWLLSMLFFPILGLWMAVARAEGRILFSLPRTWTLLRWGPALLLGFLTINFAFLLFLFFDSSVWDMCMRLFSWLIPPEAGKMHLYTMYTTAFMISFVAHWAWLMLVLGGVLQYFSNLEIVDATRLREGLAQVGAHRQIRGLARE